MSAEIPTRGDWKELLASLRWDADMLVTNPFSERVWLKPALDESGNRIGITDCCPEEFPCERHIAAAPSGKRVEKGDSRA